MEYLLVIILQLLGIGFHVGQKILAIDARYPDDSLSDVFKIFMKEDKITLFISGLVLILNVVGIYITEYYTDFEEKFEYFHLTSFGVALVMGYAGQRLIYKYLGKAEEVLNKKADQFK